MTREEKMRCLFRHCENTACEFCKIARKCVEWKYATDSEIDEAWNLLHLTETDNDYPPKAYDGPLIEDSGERTEFSTGAVRDMHEGKGRMDLLPWYGILEVAKHCENGAKKYGEHNVDKGIPLHSLLDSAARHLAKTIAGMKDEDHLRAAAWNILWALNQRTTHPEMDDMPKEDKK